MYKIKRIKFDKHYTVIPNQLNTILNGYQLKVAMAILSYSDKESYEVTIRGIAMRANIQRKTARTNFNKLIELKLFKIIDDNIITLDIQEIDKMYKKSKDDAKEKHAKSPDAKGVRDTQSGVGISRPEGGYMTNEGVGISRPEGGYMTNEGVGISRPEGWVGDTPDKVIYKVKDKVIYKVKNKVKDKVRKNLSNNTDNYNQDNSLYIDSKLKVRKYNYSNEIISIVDRIDKSPYKFRVAIWNWLFDNTFKNETSFNFAKEELNLTSNYILIINNLKNNNNDGNNIFQFIKLNDTLSMIAGILLSNKENYKTIDQFLKTKQL